MNNHKSTELNELFKAMALAQAEIKVALKDSSNPFFKSKYANLQAVIESSRSSLCKNGLSVMQQIIPNEQGQDTLVTMLCHSSGQWISSQMKISPQKTDIQSLGSYITYLRRYCYASIVGVYDGEDDDGNEAVVHTEQIPVQYTNSTITSDEKLTDNQVKLIRFKIGQNRELLQDILKRYNITNIEDMRKSDVNPVLLYIDIKLKN